MAQYKSLQFENNASGQAAKIQAINAHARAGWRVVSESITPGNFKGEQACCFFMIFAPCAFLAGSTEGTINVTLEHPSDDPPRVAESGAAYQADDTRLGFTVLAGIVVLFFIVIGIANSGDHSASPATAVTASTPAPPVLRDTVPYRVARFWEIPNGGYGRVVVISHRLVKDSALRVLAAQLVAYTRNDRNAMIDVFDNENAAAMSAHIPEGNDERGRFYDRHFVAQYVKNANSGVNEWTLMVKGLNGPAVHVTF